MADIELRKRLAAACGMAMNDTVLDSIYERLVNMEKGSIPLTLKFVFSVNEEGELSVDFTSKVNLPLDGFHLALSSNGKQLTLPVGVPIPNAAPPPPPPPPPMVQVPPEPSFDDVEPPAPQAPSPRVAARVAELRKQAKELFDAGMISKAQAKQAGVEFDD